MPVSPVAIVTGGAQGIGAAVCIELLKNGYRVCVADIEDLKAEEFVREQEKSFGKGNVIAIHCDVSKESDYSKLFEETLKYFKRVDVLINNAGVLLEHDPRKSLEVNLLGPLFGCHAALKYMGKSKGGNGGVVINTASLADWIFGFSGARAIFGSIRRLNISLPNTLTTIVPGEFEKGETGWAAYPSECPTEE
ncbi:15-hydroxyprostaglandin dehydrogenase [NAD(+)] [Araneus ventricosus]|uniref:15-hydroxyprostaglandin dehydrogenase [NAD(+)] n=2 Tax=Araneus ventricosus TaxID=182803 RepID=A0A4Y2LP69_ARAVE|nr:15-hydroxyprostaglandin dehydrogenase [NAD(+)] [Araneus ventricosus]GBN96172.1 15-hydroxyprostaglandin dehydrogenase [NAD(+)] [Araneus ventricosus]